MACFGWALHLVEGQTGGEPELGCCDPLFSNRKKNGVEWDLYGYRVPFHTHGCACSQGRQGCRLSFLQILEVGRIALLQPMHRLNIHACGSVELGSPLLAVLYHESFPSQPDQGQIFFGGKERVALERPV